MTTYNRERERHWFQIILLFVTSVAAFGTLLLHPPLHDYFNEFLPERFVLVNSIRHGIFPLWNPYQSMGTPTHADPQSGAFYPLLWFFAIFGEYTSISCAFDFILHAFIAACGFYTLTFRFTRHRWASFITAAAYIMSGFFVGNAQHLSWIIAGAWLPWVLWACFSLFEEPDLKNALLTAVFAALLLTGGYPGFAFVLVYIVALLFLYYIIRHLRNRNWQGLRRLIAFSSIALAASVLLATPTLYSILSIRSHITRGEGLPYESIKESLTAPCLLSVFLPGSLCSNEIISHTDASMCSLFMGLLTPFFVVIGIIKNKNVPLWIFFGTGILALLTAFGTNLPFHKLAYNYLPLISFIRLPALFRIFFIFPTLLLSGIGLACVMDEWPTSRKHLVMAFGMALILLIISLILTISSFQADMSNHPRILAELGIGVAVISTALAFTLLQKNKGTPLLWVVLFLIDLLVHTHLCGPYTVYDVRVKHDAMPPDTYVTDYPIPDSLTSWQEIIHEHPYYIWENAGCYRKKVEWHSRNPLIFHEHKRMVQAYREMDSVMRLPIAFFPSVVSSDTSHSFYDADTIYTTDILTQHYDSTYNSALRIREFSPKQIVIETRTNKERPLVLCQNVVPWWQVTTEKGERVEIVAADHSLLCIQAPQGQHTITFKYHRPILPILFILECIGIVAAMVFILIYSRKK
ncbi:MAG: YfhO family protein [Bacteroidales bacterium]|nr:YfhO family protein [Bacteroidales bacterium]